MNTLKKLTLISTIAISIPAVLYANNNPQSPFDEFKTAATDKMIAVKNTLEKHYEPIKPYVNNPIGFGGACLLSAVVGIKPVLAVLILGGGLIIGSREIIKYIEKAEKTSQNDKNSSSSADKS